MTSFFISLQSSSRAHSAAPRFQTEPTSLGFGLGPPLRGGFFLSQKILILTVSFKIKGHLLCRCPFILGSAAQRAAPPFGISGRAAPAPRFSPAAKTACAAHSRRGPEGLFGGSSTTVPSIQNINFNYPFQLVASVISLATSFFHFIAKLITRSFCCSSLPKRTRRWAPVLERRFAAALSHYGKISILAVLLL